LYTNQCLEALSQNPKLVNLVLTDRVQVSAGALAEFLQTTQTLRFLYLPMAITDNDQVAAALGTNTSIVDLSANCLNESSNATTLLGHIGRRAIPLQELHLSGSILSTEVLAALSSLASSSSTIIPLLSIKDVVIGKHFLKLLNALSSCRGPCMITKFKLVNVTCDEAMATEILVGVEAQIKSSRTDNVSDVAPANSATLKEIAFQGFGRNEGAADVKLLTAVTLNAQYTVERLECKWSSRRQGDDAIDGHGLLWSKMEEHLSTWTHGKPIADNGEGNDGQSQPPFRRLREIALDHILTGNNNDDNAMFNCLPKLVSLQTLATNQYPRHQYPYRRYTGYQHFSTENAIRSFATAIRGNGSLTKLDMPDQFQWSAAAIVPASTQQKNRVGRIVGAALQRTEKLPLLLARPPTRSAAAQSNQDNVDRVSLSPPQDRMRPHLLVAALPAQFMTPHFVLLGLTALSGESESHMMLSAAGKRSAPSTMK
jgi:hypothetical protein